MHKRIIHTLTLAIIGTFFLQSVALGTKQAFLTPATFELLTLCYQATLLYYNREDFVLPTYPEKHVLVTTLRGPDDNEDVFGFISETPTRIFVVFRGTQSIGDVKRDLNCRKVPFHLVPNGGSVHQGFLTSYTRVGEGRNYSLREFIRTTLSNLDASKTVYITGHSMGGAVATLCALDISQNSQFKQPILCTFASPRVGDSQFVALFNSSINQSVRVSNYYDFVPRTPPEILGYRHVKGDNTIRRRINAIENHRILSTYFPCVVSDFANFIYDLLRFNPVGLIPPLPNMIFPGRNREVHEYNKKRLKDGHSLERVGVVSSIVG